MDGTDLVHERERRLDDERLRHGEIEVRHVRETGLEDLGDEAEVRAAQEISDKGMLLG